MMLFLLLAVLAGAMLPVQTGVNVQLRGLLGQPLAAALVSFLVGTLGLVAVVALLRVPVPVGAAWGRSVGRLRPTRRHAAPTRGRGAHRGRRDPGPPVAGGVASDPAA